MRCAIIESGVVVNICKAPAEYAESKGWIVVAENIGIGWLYDGDSFEAPEIIINLAEIKASLKNQIDTAAETARLKYITGGSGQAMTYQQKADEAARCLVEETPIADNYPLLSAEIGITAPDLIGVAAVVSEAHALWRNVGGAIEAARLGAKAAVDAAEDADTATAAASVIWP